MSCHLNTSQHINQIKSKTKKRRHQRDTSSPFRPSLVLTASSSFITVWFYLLYLSAPFISSIIQDISISPPATVQPPLNSTSTRGIHTLSLTTVLSNCVTQGWDSGPALLANSSVSFIFGFSMLSLDWYLIYILNTLNISRQNGGWYTSTLLPPKSDISNKKVRRKVKCKIFCRLCTKIQTFKKAKDKR